MPLIPIASRLGFPAAIFREPFESISITFRKPTSGTVRFAISNGLRNAKLKKSEPCPVREMPSRKSDAVISRGQGSELTNELTHEGAGDVAFRPQSSGLVAIALITATLFPGQPSPPRPPLPPLCRTRALNLGNLITNFCSHGQAGSPVVKRRHNGRRVYFGEVS